MKKFKALLLTIVTIFLIIFVLILIKKPFIESYLSAKMKTDVTFAKVSIGLNKMIIEDFKLKNLKKNKSKYAFTAKKIEIYYSFKKLYSEPSIIDSISVDDVQLAINCNNPLCSTNNWTEIVSKIKEKESEVKPKEFLIKSLTFREINVEITGFGVDFTQKKTKYISYLEFKNIGSNTGFPTAQLIATIFGSSGLTDYIKSVIDPKNVIEKAFKGIKIFGFNENSIDASKN